MKKLTTTAISLLSDFICNENIAIPPAERVDKNIYDEAKMALNRIGGVYKRGHFKLPGDAKTLINAIIKSGVLPEKNPYALFETPTSIITDMRDSLDLETLIQHRRWAFEEGLTTNKIRVLEPSCGRGAILNILAQYSDVIEIVAVEIDPINIEYLRNCGFTAICMDFLEYNCSHEIKVDIVFMNPPFSRGNKSVYFYHIRHAFEMLNSGGTLISVVPTTFLQSNGKAEVDFCNLLAENSNGSMSILGKNTFKQVGTTIDTGIIVLEKGVKETHSQSYEVFDNYYQWSFSIFINNNQSLSSRLHGLLADYSDEAADQFIDDAIILARHSLVFLSTRKKADYHNVIDDEFYSQYRRYPRNYEPQLELLLGTA